MKAFILALGVLGAGTAFADPVEGLWKTEPGDDGRFGHVQVAPCGAALCGTLVQGFDATGTPRESPNLGRLIVWDMTAEGDGAYGGGQVWAPDRDKTYEAKMRLAGDVLSVSGCVMGGLICRSQDWHRVK